MSDVNQLAAFLQSNDEPASEVIETTGDTDEHENVQDNTDDDYEENSEELEVSEETETDEQDEEQDPADWHTVKVDGEELQVTLDEALKGYQRDADYRKKTMSLSEERKAVDGEKSRLSELVQKVDAFIKNEQDSINWEELRQENPEQYIAKKEEIQKAEEVKAQAVAEQQTYRKSVVDNEIKSLIESMGGDDVWSGEQRNSDLKLASDYLKNKGFADSDIDSMIDHRLWMITFDAAKSEKFKVTEAKVKEQVRNAPKSVKPGQKMPAGQRKIKQVQNKIKNSRNSQDGINGLAELIKLQGR